MVRPVYIVATSIKGWCKNSAFFPQNNALSKWFVLSASWKWLKGWEFISIFNLFLNFCLFLPCDYPQSKGKGRIFIFCWSRSPKIVSDHRFSAAMRAVSLRAWLFCKNSPFFPSKLHAPAIILTTQYCDSWKRNNPAGSICPCSHLLHVFMEHHDFSLGLKNKTETSKYFASFPAFLAK